MSFSEWALKVMCLGRGGETCLICKKQTNKSDFNIQNEIEFSPLLYLLSVDVSSLIGPLTETCDYFCTNIQKYCNMVKNSILCFALFSVKDSIVPQFMKKIISFIL